MIHLLAACRLGTLALFVSGLPGDQATGEAKPRQATEGAIAGDQAQLRSEVLSTEAGERILLEEIVLHAPVAQVWKAYTTEDG